MPHRKHLLLFLLSSSIAWHCTGQETVAPKVDKNEVFLTVFSYKSSYGLPFAPDFVGSFFSGFGYKRHFGRHALRLDLDYRDNKESWQYESTGTATYLEGQFNLGYQYTFLEKSVQPYAAVDFFYQIGKRKSESYGGFWGYEYFMENVDKHGIGFGPAVGVKFLLPKSFSISFEGNFEFLWIHTKGTSIRNEYPDINARNTYPEDSVYFSWLINPLESFSLNYDF